MLSTWLLLLTALGPQLGGGGSGVEAAHRATTASQLALIENRGQWEVDATYVGRLGPLVVRLEPDAVALQLGNAEGGALVRLSFEGGEGSAVPTGREQRPEHYSYFLGDDPSRWQRAVPAWQEVVYYGAWPGVDMVVRGVGPHLKYDLLAAPTADLGGIILGVDGAEGLHLEADGSLVIETAAGPIVQPPSVSYETLPSGERRPTAVRYQLLGGMRFGFEAIERDPALPLVIDPGLIWSTYIGSASVENVGDRVQAIALGPSGEAIVAGVADWIDFPVTPGAYSSPPGTGERAFVSVFDASGSALVYSCVVGGDTSVSFGYTRALAVGVDARGEVIAAGWTSHLGFPTTPGSFDPVKSGGKSAFVFKLRRDGSDLVYSTLLEGSQAQEAYALAVTPGGAAVVGGWTNSPDFPVTLGVFDTVLGPGEPAFLARLDPTGSVLEWATYLSGTARANAIVLDTQENVLVTGPTGGNFPVTPAAFDTTFNGSSGWDGFVAKLSADGKTLIWGTYLGGLVEDRPDAIALDPQGGVVVAGATQSWDLPSTPGSFQPQHHPSGSFDCFITRLNSTGGGLIASTYLGWIGNDEVFGVAVDAGGITTIAGVGGGTSFPVTPGAYDTITFNTEAFVARFSPDLGRLYYSSFVGGNGHEQFNGLAMDPSGIITAGGWTTGNYPVTPGAFATTPFGGQTDGMVTRMDLLPKGAVSFGTSTPACYGPLVIGVTEMPAAGSSTFGLYASGAPPGSSGLLGLAPSALTPGLPIVGLTLLIDPGPGLIVLPATAQSTPYAEVTVPIPAGATGHQAHAQFVFLNTATCGGVGTFSATNALALRVQ